MDREAAAEGERESSRGGRDARERERRSDRVPDAVTCGTLAFTFSICECLKSNLYDRDVQSGHFDQRLGQ